MVIFVLVFGMILGAVIENKTDKPTQEHHYCSDQHQQGCK